MNNHEHAQVATPSILTSAQLVQALPGALRKLDPRMLLDNPVMLVVEIGAVATTIMSCFTPSTMGWLVTVWLWLTVLFGTLAESVAEGRGKAQAASLRSLQAETTARRRNADGAIEVVSSTSLNKGDVVMVAAGERIPGDGDVIEGVASVDESAVTGESAPVIRESGGDRSAVTGGTTVLSDEIAIRITSEPGHSFVDRMIALVEGSERQKTPNEVALNILLVVLTAIFLVVCGTLYYQANYSHAHQSWIVLTALMVCLIPTTIGALLSAIGIAGMDRLVRRNVLAMSGRAVEAAGDIDVLLLDKTGTITYGNRRATEVLPVPGVSQGDVDAYAKLSSLADETPEGRSIVELISTDVTAPAGTTLVEFSAMTRMSGLDAPGLEVRKGAASAVTAWVAENGGTVPSATEDIVVGISSAGGTPLVVACKEASAPARVLGVIHLKDVVKEGIRERFEDMRAMGIKTVMITGDNAITAKAIAAEAGVDDFLAEATPEDKLALIREQQRGGRMVAMCGDGTNDAPALAQADVGVAMNTGTTAAKEAGNMVDLDSDPTKLIDVVEIGKQLLITRGALTTFSIANDIAKYFAILPAMFVAAFPKLKVLNIMHLATPQSAIVSAVVFNALIIVALIPLALKGVQYRPSSADALLKRNLLIYGVGGLIAPFLGIKLLDLGIHLIPGL